MSHRPQAEAAGEDAAREDHRAAAPRGRQHNGTTVGEAPGGPRRSWRPCQMLSQEGQPSSHHHHHHNLPHHQPTSRGPPRHRRKPPPQGHGHQIQDPDQEVPAHDHTPPGTIPPSGQEAAEFRGELEPRAVQQHPRPGVARYRRHGDPNPRVRAHRQRQPTGEAVGARHQDVGTPDQIPVAVDAPDLPSSLKQSPISGAEEALSLEKLEEPRQEQEEEIEPQRDDIDSRAGEDDGGCRDNRGVGAEYGRGRGAEAERLEDRAEPGAETTDLCSDTESAASLSMDAPLHSPPPLHSPTPPPSPDAPRFRLPDPCSSSSNDDDPDSGSPTHHEEDPLPEDDEERSGCYGEPYRPRRESAYTESRQKSPKKPARWYSDPYAKPYPSSFPEPLHTGYPELQRDPPRGSGRGADPGENHQDPPRGESGPSPGQQDSTASPNTPRRDAGPALAPASQGRSVGSRLHHYNAQSDGEGDSTDGSPSSKSLAPAGPRPEPQGKLPVAHAADGGPEEAAARASGDAISLAIRDIKEAIEEVKTKTVRSPYTPDQPEEPIWVMRQEVSPQDEGYSQNTAACHGGSAPHSPPHSPPHYAREPAVSAGGAEASRLHHYLPHHLGGQAQHRDAARPSPPCAHPSQHPQTPPQPGATPQSPQTPSVQDIRRSLSSFPTYVDVPGPCDPEDLIDGIIFAASYLGSTHLLSERTPTKSARMQQAQEAMNRVRRVCNAKESHSEERGPPLSLTDTQACLCQVDEQAALDDVCFADLWLEDLAAQKQAKNRKKSPESEIPSTAEVDLFMSTQRIKVLNADTQETMMDLPLRTISYIADIGNMVVLMARGKMVRSRSAQDQLESSAEQETMSNDDRRLYRMICHVFESEDAQLIAQSIGQSFSVAYQEFLRANGIDPEDLSQREYSDLLNTQDMYNDDLIHFSKSENCKDVYIDKQKGEIVGVVIVESGWGSILPTVIIASMMHAGPAEKSGRLNIGDQIMTINGTSLVGLPLNTCQSIIKGLKSQSRIKMNIVRCPPVTMVLIRRPDLRYQLGFSVQNGIICSLMRGGIAERGGVRVGHRIIEINSQSVVATPHEKIVQILSNAMGEIHMKTMPAAMYRLLTAQEQPVYI